MFRPVTRRLVTRLTPEERAWWGRRLRDPLTIAFTLSLLVLTILLVMGMATVYRLQREMTLLRIEYNAHIKDQQAKDTSIRQEFDTIYQSLYQPPAPTSLRKQTYVELWQANRDKELRDRIRQLEIRMGRLER